MSLSTEQNKKTKADFLTEIVEGKSHWKDFKVLKD